MFPIEEFSSSICSYYYFLSANPSMRWPIWQIEFKFEHSRLRANSFYLGKDLVETIISRNAKFPYNEVLN